MARRCLPYELASDSGHIVDATPQTAYISGKQQDVVQLYFGNSPKSSLLISKVDTKGGQLSSKGLYQTEANGEIRISGVVGTIVAKEVKIGRAHV